MDGIFHSEQQHPFEIIETKGVSVYHLKHVFLEGLVQLPAAAGQLPLGRSSRIHQIEDLSGPPGLIRQKGPTVVCPVDGKIGSAYVHCLDGEDHVGNATYLLSYCWSYAIGDVVDALCEFCETNSLDPKRTYIWIDCFCINQHRVVEQKETGGTGMLNFEQEFPVKLAKIGHMLAMMSPWKEPVYLTRVWCIFELYTAQRIGCKVDIIMPPTEANALEQDILGKGGGINILYEAFGKTRVQNASATIEDDRRTILGLIESAVGFQILNNQVNELLRGWVKYALLGLVEARECTNDEDFANFCGMIGSIFSENGEYNSALDLYSKCLVVRENILGKDHPDAAATTNDIGEVLQSKGDYDGALEQYKRCLAIRESVLGMDHSETAISYACIGSLMQARGDFDGAVEQYRRCVNIQEAQLGKNHPETANTYSMIGNVLHSKGDYDGALEQYRICLVAIQESSLLGQDHPCAAAAYVGQGSVLQSKGDFDNALKQFQKGLVIQEAVLGNEHPDTATTYSQIGSIMKSNGDYEGALEQYQKCLSIRKSFLGIQHCDTAAVYNSIGSVLEKQGDFDGALEHYQKCLAINEDMLGVGHPSTAAIYNNIGKALKGKGNAVSALEYCQKSLAINEATLGVDHPSTATAYGNIGSLLKETGDYDAALDQYQKCLAIREASLGPDHPQTRATRKSIKYLLRKKKIEESEPGTSESCVVS